MTLCTPLPEGAGSDLAGIFGVQPLEVLGGDALQHIRQAVAKVFVGLDGAAVRVTAPVISLPPAFSLCCKTFLPCGAACSMPQPLGGIVLGEAVPRVDDEAERGCGHADDVEDPEARLRDGCERVVADVGAPRLQGVTHKHLLLIGVHVLGGHGDDQQPEDDHHCEPQAPDHGGVLVHGIEEALEQSPLRHGGLWLPAASRRDELPGVEQPAPE